jgi:hypothetical protein
LPGSRPIRGHILKTPMFTNERSPSLNALHPVRGGTSAYRGAHLACHGGTNESSRQIINNKVTSCTCAIRAVYTFIAASTDHPSDYSSQSCAHAPTARVELPV